MKTISVSVDEETHRLAKIMAAEKGTTLSAMVRELLTALLQSPPDDVQMETEHRKDRRELLESTGRIRAEGNRDFHASERLSREEMYNTRAPR